MNIYSINILLEIMNKNKEKPCPEGKVLNPLTGRCVNKEAYEKKLKKEKKLQESAQAAQEAEADLLQNNKKIIDKLKILADYERINNEPFKVKAYEKVIDSIELYDKNIESVEDIKGMKGVGKK